jgi:NAD(P)-dependent dehydrogenase (short-subunit alcohol dehydrogenase family)
MSERPLWLVLGASSSVARAFARQAAEGGADLILAGRDIRDIDRIAADARIRGGGRVDVRAFDAIDHAGHEAFVADLPRRPFNAFLAFGMLAPQAEIDRSPALAQEIIAVNYLGAVSVLSRLAPRMAAEGKGAIVVLSSVAGDRGRPSNYTYGSAKAGLNAYLQGLRASYAAKGISLITVKPGFMDTSMTYGMSGMFLVASPQACAKACLGYATKGRDVVYFPGFWWLIMAIIKAIPERIFKRLKL